MASVNKVHLLGNVGRDPEVRYLPSGQAVANVSIATSTRRKDKQTGDVTEDTQWHRVTFYDRLAEIAGEYVRKGNPIYVEGRLKYGKYTGQDGIEKATCDIVATELQLLGGREQAAGGDQQGHPGQGQQGYQSQPRQAPAQRPPQQQRPQQRQDARSYGTTGPAPGQRAPAGAVTGSGFDDMDSDIPF